MWGSSASPRVQSSPSQWPRVLWLSVWRMKCGLWSLAWVGAVRCSGDSVDSYGQADLWSGMGCEGGGGGEVVGDGRWVRGRGFA